jgi:hypothetical protein
VPFREEVDGTGFEQVPRPETRGMTIIASVTRNLH